MRDRPVVALVVAAIAAALVVLARRHAPIPVAPPADEASTASGNVIARPPEAVAELGVLTEAAESDLDPLRDPKQVASLLDERECGDALGAVRAFASRALVLDVMPSTFWPMPSFEDLADVTSTLTDDERAKLNRPLRLVSVRVSGPGAPDQLPARTAFAAAIAIARVSGGLVYDRVDDRIESAETFAMHAIVAPLGASAFRSDRIEIRYMARADGNVRLITSGLLRFGAPDVDVAAVEPHFAAPLADVVTGVARALVDGARTSPIDLDVDGAKLRVELADVHPESGDPNTTMVRIASEGETTPAAYARLAAKIPSDAGEAPTPSDDELDASRVRTQRQLGGVLERFTAYRDAGALLYVQLPFEYVSDAGEAGEEWMWVEVERWDDVSLDGKLVDAPDYVTSLHRGDLVHRPRKEATAYQLTTADGGVDDGRSR
jgi:Uncharacterized protein conserved in bacteria (DUF2314)